MRRALLASLAFFCAHFVGCATLDQKLGDQEWYRKTRAATGKALDVSAGATSKAYGRMQEYLAKRELLATFQDAGEHGEDAVLAVLQRAGMTRAAPPAQAPGRTGDKPSAAKPPQPSKPATPPSSASAPPQKYAGTLIWPVQAGIFSSEFGTRRGRPHKGIDIAADIGEPIYAIADGEVIYAGEGLRGYGKVVIVRHDARISSLYAHNSELKVKQGDHVARGELVSLLGNTGRSTGPHVHFEIRDAEVAVDPRALLPKPEFGKVAAVAEPCSSSGCEYRKLLAQARR